MPVRPARIFQFDHGHNGARHINDLTAHYPTYSNRRLEEVEEGGTLRAAAAAPSHTETKQLINWRRWLDQEANRRERRQQQDQHGEQLPAHDQGHAEDDLEGKSATSLQIDSLVANVAPAASKAQDHQNKARR